MFTVTNKLVNSWKSKYSTFECNGTFEADDNAEVFRLQLPLDLNIVLNYCFSTYS